MRVSLGYKLFVPLLLALSAAGPLHAQPDRRADRSVAFGSVPRLMKFADRLVDRSGAARSGALGLTFALYAEREGGTPLWMETQNVLLDEGGRYSALLGAATQGGLPAELFASGEPRWLGVQVLLPGEGELPRVLLVSVPYAMKAADAETLGGRPATDYLLREQLSGWSRSDEQVTNRKQEASNWPFVVDGSGSVNRVPRFVSPSIIGDSQISDDGTTVAIGTPGSAARFEVSLTTATGQLVQNNDVTLNNTAAVGVVSPMRLRLFDDSRAAVDSKQALRVVYRRQATATGAVLNFDSGLTIASFMDGNAPYAYRTFNVEGPRVAAGRTLQTLYGLFIEAPFNLGGTITNKFAVVSQPGAGNWGINTTSPQEALHVVGNVRASGLSRLGSETGTTEPPTTQFDGPTTFPYTGMLVRRVISTETTAGSVVARSSDLSLQRDGTDGGFRVVSTASFPREVRCQGISDGGSHVGTTLAVAAGVTATVFSNSLNVVFFQCILGDLFNGRHHAEVTLGRRTGDFFWVGSVRSTFDQ